MDMETAFVSILCCALQGRPLIPVEEGLFASLLDRADQQHLFGMISEKLAEDPIFCSSALFERALQKNVRHTMEQKRRDTAFFKLYRAMEEKGLQPLVMKGMACRKAYGELGRLRPSGDEDLLVRPQDFEKARQVLLAEGYETGKGLKTIASEMVHHVVFQKNGGYTVELHVRPMGLETPFLRQMDRYFDDAFTRAVSFEYQGHRLYTLSPTDHYLLLIFHAAKHFMGQGFGIRLLADVAMFCQYYGRDICLADVEKALKACHLYPFYSDMVHLANRELGFSLPEAGKTVCPDVLRKEILKSGVFGEKSAISSLASIATRANIRHKKAWKALWHMLFPARETVLIAHPEWKDKPLKRWMHYPKRWGQAARLVLFKGQASPLQSLRLSRERLQLMKRYGMQ